MIKIFEAFAGYGSQSLALKRVGVDYEIVGISEIDKYALMAYKSLHGDVENYGDISKMDRIPLCDIFTYSFPCQDISVAGKQEGIKEGTRSGLLLEVERLLETSDKPKVLLMENVKNLTGKKHKKDFIRWCDKLEALGYTNYWSVLNARDYGIPQNRERVFMISIFKEHNPFNFPSEVNKTRVLDDLFPNKNNKITINEKIKPSVRKNFIRELEYIEHTEKDIYQCKCDSGWQDNKIGIKVSPTLRANNDNCFCLINGNIRKLTSDERFVLMGLKEDEIKLINKTGISTTQLNKMSGNSIVVDVLEYIFKELFKSVEIN